MTSFGLKERKRERGREREREIRVSVCSVRASSRLHSHAHRPWNTGCEVQLLHASLAGVLRICRVCPYDPINDATVATWTRELWESRRGFASNYFYGKDVRPRRSAWCNNRRANSWIYLDNCISVSRQIWNVIMQRRAVIPWILGTEPRDLSRRSKSEEESQCVLKRFWTVSERCLIFGRYKEFFGSFQKSKRF